MLPALFCALGVVAVIAYGKALALPFLNDDYLFLDKVRSLSFPDLWKPEQLIFGWYRPWSREFHYWALQRLFGLNEGPYHAVSLGLWLAILVLYFDFIRRLGGTVTALVAASGLSTLALWSAPLLWIAGAQDLWMLLFGLLFLHAVRRGQVLLSLAALLLSLLSKETAAALPGIATAYVLLIHRSPPRTALRQVTPLWVTLALWALLHPTLSQRFFGPLQHSPETATRPSVPDTIAKTLLAQFNLDAMPSPEAGWEIPALRGAVMGMVLGLLILACRRHAEPPESPSRATGLRETLFAVTWSLMGWSILLMPSIGWHAYYGVLGSLGCWFAIGLALRHHALPAVALILCLAVLREARAATPSWDWGTYWYQKRAGSFLGAIRTKVRGLYPDLAPRSRIFLARLPNNIGLLAGDGPAFRVWYDDSTLEAHYYSEYSLRAPHDTLGSDYFFRFDSLTALVEVVPGRREPMSAIGGHPGWKRDHQVLASVLLRGGETRTAAEEYEKLWHLEPRRLDYAVYAAAAYEAAGDKDRATPLYVASRRALGDSAVDASAPQLVASARAYRDAALRRVRSR